jgi:3-dehydroquinate dehydratase/shikimate dehydrogenase
MADTVGELRRLRDQAVDADADLVELRLDGLAEPDVAGALAGRTRPAVVTCRPTWEGGAFRGSEEERRRILSRALSAGAEYIDVEFKAGFADLVRAGGPRVVLSTHDFSGLPADLGRRVATMREAGAGIVKVAVTATSLSDCLPLLDLAESTVGDQPRYVWIAMGMPGVPTRVLAARFRSAWMYAGDNVAPGQLSAGRMIEEFGFRWVTPDSAVYGVIGSPVGHSVSPAIHNAAFRAARRDAVYLPLEPSDFDDFVRVARRLGIVGASVTIPFKVPAFEYLVRSGEADAIDDLSRAVGAVNTLRRVKPDGRWQGRNTDVAGFLAPLADRTALKDLRATILGAGGAARAVAVALGSAGAAVTVCARRADRAAEVSRLAGGTAQAWPPKPASWDVLVNATPLGMSPGVDETPWPGAVFDGRLVYDLVYNPAETRLLREARAAGCETIGGLDMLVAQAQEQSAWWTGVRPPGGPLRAAAGRALGLQDLDRPVHRS